MNRAKTMKWSALAAVAVALLAAGLTGAAPALAATPSPSSTPSPSGAGQNCAYIVPVKQTVCAPVTEDLHAAVLKATGYQVLESTAASPQSSAGVTPASVFVLAKLYDDQNMGGSNYEVDGSGACTSAVIGVGNIGSSWYGRVSSFAGYSNCRVKIWESTGYSGASLGFYASKSYVGDALNDRTKSVQVTK